MVYVITGATGNTGKPLAESLLAEGKKVRIITRDASKAADLAAKGAEVVVGNTTSYETMNEAFKGAHAVYFMIPPDPSKTDFTGYQRETAHAGAAAIIANKVPYVVTLSSIGAHLPEGAGVVQGLQIMESIFDNLQDTNVLHLRPGYFMENLLGQVGGIKQMGAMGAPVSADKKISMIATRDIANFALHQMLNPSFKGTGNHIHLLGPESFTYTEAAAAIGKAIGKEDLAYHQLPLETFKQFIMSAWGGTESFADRMIEFTESLNAGRIEEKSEENVIRTHTKLADWLPVFQYVYSL